MTIIEMIAEWRRGCSDAAPDSPELCAQCTRGLIDAIERKELSRLKVSSGPSGDELVEVFVSESGELIGFKSESNTYFGNSKVHQAGDVQSC